MSLNLFNPESGEASDPRRSGKVVDRTPSELGHFELELSPSLQRYRTLYLSATPQKTADRVEKLAADTLVAMQRPINIRLEELEGQINRSRNGIENAIERGFRYLANEPTVDSSKTKKLITVIFEVLPVLRAMKEYASARDKYFRGINEERPELVIAARREFLGACAAMGVDLSLLGVAPMVAKYQGAVEGLGVMFGRFAPTIALPILLPIKGALERMVNSIKPTRFLVRTLADKASAARIADLFLSLVEAKS